MKYFHSDWANLIISGILGSMLTVIEILCLSIWWLDTYILEFLGERFSKSTQTLINTEWQWWMTATHWEKSARVINQRKSLPCSPEPEVEVFKMTAYIPGRNRAVFLLTYEELLQRRLGRYEHVTSLRPMQLVSRLSLDVTIVDHSAITDLQVLPLRNGRSTSSSGSNAPKTPGSHMPLIILSVHFTIYVLFL